MSETTIAPLEADEEARFRERIARDAPVAGALVTESFESVTTVRRLLVTLDRERAALAEARKLLSPEVQGAAAYIMTNAERHPEACCAKCADGLADRDRLAAECAAAMVYDAARRGAQRRWNTRVDPRQ